MLAATLDSNGQIAGCPFVQTITLTATPWTIPVITTTATVVTNSPTASDIGSFSTANGTLATSTRTSTVSDVCNAAPQLTATAAASTTSGTAPLTVNFTGAAANGTQPYTWEWDFGDGSPKSNQQNPSHTYNDPGSYPVTLKVTDAAAKTATDDHLTIDVSAGCALFCTASAPASGAAAQAVSFVSTLESSDCTGSPDLLLDVRRRRHVVEPEPEPHLRRRGDLRLDVQRLAERADAAARTGASRSPAAERRRTPTGSRRSRTSRAPAPRSGAPTSPPSTAPAARPT